MIASSGRITDETPRRSGPKISQIESTNPRKDFWQQVFASKNGYVSHIHKNRFLLAQCVSSTPVDLPILRKFTSKFMNISLESEMDILLVSSASVERPSALNAS